MLWHRSCDSVKLGSSSTRRSRRRRPRPEASAPAAVPPVKNPARKACPVAAPSPPPPLPPLAPLTPLPLPRGALPAEATTRERRLRRSRQVVSFDVPQRRRRRLRAAARAPERELERRRAVTSAAARGTLPPARAAVAWRRRLRPQPPLPPGAVRLQRVRPRAARRLLRSAAARASAPAAANASVSRVLLLLLRYCASALDCCCASISAATPAPSSSWLTWLPKMCRSEKRDAWSTASFRGCASGRGRHLLQLDRPAQAAMGAPIGAPHLSPSSHSSSPTQLTAPA